MGYVREAFQEKVSSNLLEALIFSCACSVHFISGELKKAVAVSGISLEVPKLGRPLKST